jgi:hypothetical protein
MKGKTEVQRKMITRQELRRLEFCGKPPSPVELNGRKLRYVGIGWIDEGKASGDEVLVTD